MFTISYEPYTRTLYEHTFNIADKRQHKEHNIL